MTVNQVIVLIIRYDVLAGLYKTHTSGLNAAKYLIMSASSYLCHSIETNTKPTPQRTSFSLYRQYCQRYNYSKIVITLRIPYSTRRRNQNVTHCQHRLISPLIPCCSTESIEYNIDVCDPCLAEVRIKVTFMQYPLPNQSNFHQIFHRFKLLHFEMFGNPQFLSFLYQLFPQMQTSA